MPEYAEYVVFETHIFPTIGRARAILAAAPGQTDSVECDAFLWFDQGDARFLGRQFRYYASWTLGEFELTTDYMITYAINWVLSELQLRIGSINVPVAVTLSQLVQGGGDMIRRWHLRGESTDALNWVMTHSRCAALRTRTTEVLAMRPMISLTVSEPTGHRNG